MVVPVVAVDITAVIGVVIPVKSFVITGASFVIVTVDGSLWTGLTVDPSRGKSITV